jgi:alkylated DNA repair dioxygenase AlkB
MAKVQELISMGDITEICPASGVELPLGWRLHRAWACREPLLRRVPNLDGNLAALETNEAWLDDLRALPWEIPQVKVFGKIYATPRRVLYYGDPGTDYQYSGHRHSPLNWTSRLAFLREVLGEFLGWRPTAVLCNHYRDGQDSMGWHRDNEPELGPNPAIASVSFGARRDFDLRHGPSGRKLRVTLGEGDLLWMAPGGQTDWEHQVPKRARAGERINLTFRRLGTG